jgi:hypothetical protein
MFSDSSVWLHFGKKVAGEIAKASQLPINMTCGRIAGWQGPPW